MSGFRNPSMVAIAVGVLFLLGSRPTPAQQAAPPQAPHSMTMPQPASDNPEVSAFTAANEKMHQVMDAPLTGNADWDFALVMIPHHQGAIDMARIELQYGKDPELRKLAEDIIAAQEKEIAFMKQWQQRHN